MHGQGFKCKYPACLRIYASKYNLSHHVTFSHPGFHQFRCQTCLKVLSTKDNFRQHLILHTGELPYRCEMCGDRFRQAGQFGVHRRGHLKEARKVGVCKVRSR